MRYKDIIRLFIAATAFCACGGDDAVLPDEPSEPTKPEEEEPELREDERPTDWVVDMNLWDPAYSMTLTVEVALPDYAQHEVHSGDMMAAFMCGRCRSCQPPVTKDGKTLFFLNVIGMTTDNPDEDKQVEIKYYSATLKHIFTTEAKVAFINGEIKGTPSNPYKPTWKE